MIDVIWDVWAVVMAIVACVALNRWVYWKGKHRIEKGERKYAEGQKKLWQDFTKGWEKKHEMLREAIVQAGFKVKHVYPPTEHKVLVKKEEAK